LASARLPSQDDSPSAPRDWGRIPASPPVLNVEILYIRNRCYSSGAP